MGTWGTGPFDNDSAAEWCRELSTKKTPETRARFVLSTPCHSTAPEEIERGVAACEAVAWLAGRGKYDAPGGSGTALGRSGLGASPLDTARARRFVELARSRASIMGWRDRRVERQWQAMLDDLALRLKGERNLAGSGKTSKKSSKKAERR